MAGSAEEIQKHVKLYWMIGYTLFGCTFITLALGIWAPLDFGAPGVSPSDIVLGLALACFKSSLVLLIFMHLNHERGLIYKTLLFTLAFAVSLMGLTLFTKANPIEPNVDVVARVDVDEILRQMAAEEPESHKDGDGDKKQDKDY